MDPEFLKILGQFGITGVALYVLGRITWQIGQRMIGAIDALGAAWKDTSMHIVVRIDEHSRQDITAIGALTRKIERLDAKIDTVLDQHERETPVQGVPYHVPDVISRPHRARTNPNETDLDPDTFFTMRPKGDE